MGTLGRRASRDPKDCSLFYRRDPPDSAGGTALRTAADAGNRRGRSYQESCREAASFNMLFHVVNDRHKRRRSMVFTTNKSTDSWGQVLHDSDLAQAIVDHVLERGRLLTLDGPSMRTRHLGLDDTTQTEASIQPAKISRITPAEFPEPTPSISKLFVA